MKMRQFLLVFFMIVSLVVAGNSQGLAADDEAEAVATEAVALPDDDVQGVETVQAPPGNMDWDLFVPPQDDEFDWIQLTSYEWLKGEVKDYYNFTLEFDSEEIGLQHFDWEDVMQIYSADYKSLRIEQASGVGTPYTVFGKFSMNGDAAQVSFGGKVTSFDRSQIISIAKGATKRSELWGGDLSLGANFRSGNSDLIDSNIIFNLHHRTPTVRFANKYVGNYSKADGEETSNNHRISSVYDVFVTADFFWRPLSGDYFRDRIKNIKHQVTAGTGLGYYLIRNPQTEWDVAGGVGVVYTESDSVLAGEESSAVSPSLSMTTLYDTALTSWLDWYFYYNAQFLEEESGRFLHHMLSTLETDLISDLELEISLVWDRVSEPQPLDDNTVPKKDDFQLIVGIGFDF